MKKKRRSRRRFPLIVYALSVMVVSLAVFAVILVAAGRKDNAVTADTARKDIAAAEAATDTRVLTEVNENPESGEISQAKGTAVSALANKSSKDNALKKAETAAAEAEEAFNRLVPDAEEIQADAEAEEAAREAAEREAEEEAARLAGLEAEEEAARQAEWEAEEAARQAEREAEEAAREAAERAAEEEAARQAEREAEEAAREAVEREAEEEAERQAEREAEEEAARQAEEAARQEEEADPEPVFSVDNDNVTYSGDYDYSADAAAYGISGGNYGYSQEECYLLACTISAEVGWSPYDTQNAVANVILDRAANCGSIRAAVFAAGQFAVTWDGALLRTFRNGPMSMAVTAAQDALNGVDIRPRPYYYFNNRDMGYTGEWIGDEYFYLIE